MSEEKTEVEFIDLKNMHTKSLLNLRTFSIEIITSLKLVKLVKFCVQFIEIMKEKLPLIIW